MSSVTISIVINCEERKIAAGKTVDDLLDQLGLYMNNVVIELNGSTPPRSEYAVAKFQDGDQVEIVTIAGGG